MGHDDKIKTSDKIVEELANLTVQGNFRKTAIFEEFFKNCTVVKPKRVPIKSKELYIKCQEVSPIRKFIDYHKSVNSKTNQDLISIYF